MNCFVSFALNVNLRRYVAELKHCRLAMIAWLGILAQAVSTNPEGTEVGPVANWSAHVADVVHCNVVDRSGCVF